jgi:hypothetical protein
VAADGPRPNRSGEVGRCEEVRRIATNVDWPCEIKTLFRETNLGCKTGVSGGINWFFKHEEAGIILEDDCLPHPDFFRFCDELLERYAKDECVAVISGSNFLKGNRRGESTYFFSKYNHCWGWATWRRAWQYYDGDLFFWPAWSSSTTWKNLVSDWTERRYWRKIFDRVYANEIDSWAYPWTASVWFNGGLTATPNVNLISNIGYGQNATHTTAENSPLSWLPTYSLGSIVHPVLIAQDSEADRLVFDFRFGGRDLRFPWSWLLFPRRFAGFCHRKIKSLIHGQDL